MSLHGRRGELGMVRGCLRGYLAYVKWRFRNEPETVASIAEFVERRTKLDRNAILGAPGRTITPLGKPAPTMLLDPRGRHVRAVPGAGAVGRPYP